MGYQIFQQRDDGRRDGDRRLLPDLGLFPGPDDLPVLQVDHVYGEVEALAGHHARIDHDQRDRGPDVSGFIQLPKVRLLCIAEGFALYLLQLRQPDE